MALAHAVAGVRARGELPARGGAPFINAAVRLLSHLAHQSCTAWPGPVRATHAAGVVGDFLNQPCGDTAPMLLGLVHGKIDTKGRTAGAAAKAGVGHGKAEFFRWGGDFRSCANPLVVPGRRFVNRAAQYPPKSPCCWCQFATVVHQSPTVNGK